MSRWTLVDILYLQKMKSKSLCYIFCRFLTTSIFCYLNYFEQCICAIWWHGLSTGVLWLWQFIYSVGPHPVSSLHIYTFVVSQAFMAGVASQAGDADSSRAPGLTSGLQGSINVHHGALLLVPQWQCITSFVFYIYIVMNFMSNLHKSKRFDLIDMFNDTSRYIDWRYFHHR